MSQSDLMLDLKIKWVPVTYISWFSDIALYFEDYLIYKVVNLAGGIREPLLTCSICYRDQSFIKRRGSVIIFIISRKERY